MAQRVVKSRWLLPAVGPPVENAALMIDDGHIVAVEAGTQHRSADDFGDAVILPGLVNAHTHLELSLLVDKVPFTGSFVGWIETLIELAPQVGRYAEAMHTGYRQSLAAGVTALGDIGIERPAVEQWTQLGLQGVGFLELLGMNEQRTKPRDRSPDTAQSLLERPGESASNDFLLGLSPHAPYTADAHIYRRAVELSQSYGVPICTHLAETRDEWQFLHDGTGPFRTLLERHGLWDGSFVPPGCSPVRYMDRLGVLAADPLLIHVNYAEDGDLDLFMKYRCSVAWCPRSHRFFGHEPHRFRDMLERGINVCLGTDSLASNDTLSILDEMRFIRREYPDLDGQVILQMATRNGALALKMASRVGTIEAGKQADFIVVPLEESAAPDPMEDILLSHQQPTAVCRKGTFYS